MSWKLQITNDPRHDFRLVFELWKDEEVRAQVEHDASGQLALTVFPSEAAHTIPVDWLIQLLNRARAELPPEDEL